MSTCYFEDPGIPSVDCYQFGHSWDEDGRCRDCPALITDVARPVPRA